MQLQGVRVARVVSAALIGIAVIWRCQTVLAFDLSHASIPRDEIFSGGPPKDGIPALTDPRRVAAEAADFLSPDDRVLGVFLDGVARAYPIRILNWHEIVNDSLGGALIVVSYCPLCGTGMVFEAERDGTRTLFGVSGLLYNNDVLLYDRATESLWSQLKMEAVTGPRLGERLEWIPVRHTTWSAWRAAHPATDVLSLETGHRRDYDRDPYAGYEHTPAVKFPTGPADGRLPPKAWVLGVLIDGSAVAYPLDGLKHGVIREETIAGRRVRIQYDALARDAWVTDDKGRSLPSVQAYWFAWSAFYPETIVDGEPVNALPSP